METGPNQPGPGVRSMPVEWQTAMLFRVMTLVALVELVSSMRLAIDASVRFAPIVSDVLFGGAAATLGLVLPRQTTATMRRVGLAVAAGAIAGYLLLELSGQGGAVLVTVFATLPLVRLTMPDAALAFPAPSRGWGSYPVQPGYPAPPQPGQPQQWGPPQQPQQPPQWGPPSGPSRG